MQKTIELQTGKRQLLVDITAEVEKIVAESGVRKGVVSVYAQGATAAVMIQENWDDSVQEDVISLLTSLVPQGVWQHDKQDGNGDAHIKAGLIGPSESIPVQEGRLGLSRWQNIFFCEFDGPKRQRRVLCTVLSSSG